MSWDFEAEPDFAGELVRIDQCAGKVRGALGPSGKAEIVNHYGALEQKTRYLAPLLDKEMLHAVAMTERFAGLADAIAAPAEAAGAEAVEAA